MAESADEDDEIIIIDHPEVTEEVLPIVYDEEADVESLVEIPKNDEREKGFSFRKLWAFTGPGFLMSIAYLDPGNIESDLQSGARAQYKLLWVLLVAHIVGLLLQRMSARLGVVSGQHMAEVAHRFYPLLPRVCLWIMIEIAIICSDMQEVIGTAIAFFILSNGWIPLSVGVLITILDTFTFLTIDRCGFRSLEFVFGLLISTMALSFAYEYVVVEPNHLEVLKGIVFPWCDGCGREQFLQAISVIGAVIMPHNLYLHSALVKTRRIDRTKRSKIAEANQYYFIESAIALSVSFFINVSVVAVFAQGLFNKTNWQIREQCDQRGDIPNPGVFPYNNNTVESDIYKGGVFLGCQFGLVAMYIWAVGIMAAGQSSTMTGTYAGQYVMEGFVKVDLPRWKRVLLTRSSAILPTLAVTLWANRVENLTGMNDLLNCVQMIQLPFALIPIITFTSSSEIMHDFKSTKFFQCFALCTSTVVIGINIYFIQDFVAPFLESSGSASSILTHLVVGVYSLIYFLFIMYLVRKLWLNSEPSDWGLCLTMENDRNSSPPAYKTQENSPEHLSAASLVIEEDPSAVQKLRNRLISSIPKRCGCHSEEAAPWTGEVHGLSQALEAKSPSARVFWWTIMMACTVIGTFMTILVVLEYISGPTATSTSIKMVGTLEFPSITICPKIPDAYNATAIFSDIGDALPQLEKPDKEDLLRFWLGGNGLENMEELKNFNRTKVDRVYEWYKVWSAGYDTKTFFNMMNEKYAYRCQEFFRDCFLGALRKDCCHDVFERQMVMRRGLCFKTKRNINQTEADDIGRFRIHMKAVAALTSPQFDYVQPQTIVYVTDNHETTVDFPRFYLSRNEYNRMRFSARFIDMIPKKEVCTAKIFGSDATCLVRKWLSGSIVKPFNCTLAYLEDSVPITGTRGTCDIEVIAQNYVHNIEQTYSEERTVDEGRTIFELKLVECMPGCKRWDYNFALQSTKSLTPFPLHAFNLELSYSAIQYEYIKEVYTTSVPGFMSQIGGQFGFFLGLSIITFVQMTFYLLHFLIVRLIFLIRCLRSYFQDSLQTLKKEIVRYDASKRDSRFVPQADATSVDIPMETLSNLPTLPLQIIIPDFSRCKRSVSVAPLDGCFLPNFGDVNSRRFNKPRRLSV